jgi:ABC-type nitrate/sulfonate/bicarbonate transport system substrate-binding protein
MSSTKINKTLCNIRSFMFTLISFLLFAFAVPASSQPTIKVRFGVNNPYFPGNTPVSVGVTTGIFKKHGLDVEMVATQSPMPPLLAGCAALVERGGNGPKAHGTCDAAR